MFFFFFPIAIKASKQAIMRRDSIYVGLLHDQETSEFDSENIQDSQLHIWKSKSSQILAFTLYNLSTKLATGK